MKLDILEQIDIYIAEQEKKPPALVYSIADKMGISKAKAESRWEKAREAAEKQGKKPSDKFFWPYVVKIFKTMMGTTVKKTWSPEEVMKIAKKVLAKA